MVKKTTNEMPYFAVRKNEEGENEGFAVGNKAFVESVAKRWEESSEDEKDLAEEENPVDENEDFTPHSALTGSLERSVNYALAHFHSIMLTTVLKDRFCENWMDRNIISPIESKGKAEKEGKKFKTYPLNEVKYEALKNSMEQLEHIRSGVGNLPNSVLMGMIGSFDALVVDIIGKMISFNPKAFTSSDSSVSMQDVLNSDDIKEIVQGFVSDELYKFSRESHEFQAEFIKKKLNVNIKDHWKRWADFIEIFERRNLVAHGEQRFNKRYASICERNGHKGSSTLIGKDVELRPDYLLQSLDILSEFAILLSFSLWRKHVPEKESEAFENLNEAAFKLISEKRNIIAERILEFGLSLNSDALTEQVRRMMVINLASAVRRGSKEIKRATKILEKEDWSASGIDFAICIASVKDDIDELCSLIPKAKANGFKLSMFRTWPVFRFHQENEKFRSTLKDVYGSDLLMLDGTEGTDKEKTPKPKKKTVH